MFWFESVESMRIDALIQKEAKASFLVLNRITLYRVMH